jgi:hypothetical protein
MMSRLFVPLSAFALLAAVAGCANQSPPPAAPFATSVAPGSGTGTPTRRGTPSPSLGSGYNPVTGTTAAGGE